MPLLGTCFGHRIIARALGAKIGCDDDGWVLGRVQTQFIETGKTAPFYAAHKKQVMQLPDGSRLVTQTQGCDLAGFALADHMLTTQYRPEMTAPFITALLDVLGHEIGRDVMANLAE